VLRPTSKVTSLLAVKSALVYHGIWLPACDAFYRDPCPLFSLILTSDSQGRLPYVAARCERLLTGRLLQGTKFCSVPGAVVHLSVLLDIAIW
jgi:hypothetical protein